MTILCRQLIIRRSKLTRNLILGIESSCDDTGAAIIDPNTKNVLAESLLKQSHSRLGGVIPTVAMKRHAQALPKVVNEVLEKVPIENIDAVAVTNRPGLNGSLVMGRNYAQYLCYKYRKPLIPIHHMEAHALTVRLTHPVSFPFLVLLISGGHCLLAFAKDINDFQLLGQSIDNAPGEVFDKIARRLNIYQNYDFRDVPGGRAIEMLGQNGDPHAYELSQPLLNQRNCMFSFSGYRSNAERLIDKLEKETTKEVGEVSKNTADFCASFEHGLAIFLGKRLQRAIEFTNMKSLWPTNSQPTIVVSGGVACNIRIRSVLEKVCESYGCQLVVPPLRYCTDNGVMIAWNGVEKWLKNQDLLPYDQVFQLSVHPRVPFGTDISNQVSEANIKVQKIPF